MTNNFLNLSSLIIGILGFAIAIFQTLNLTKVKKLVFKQGMDLNERLNHEYKSLTNLKQIISERNEISWNDSKSEILSNIHERSENISLIGKSMELFISITTGKEV